MRKIQHSFLPVIKFFNNHKPLLVILILFLFHQDTEAQHTHKKHHSAAEAVPVDMDVQKVDSFFNAHSIDLNHASKPDLYYEVYRWYNTCYRYGGNTAGGIDCSHFVNMLYEKIYGKTLGPSAGAI